jgi:hypothetical protein
VHPLDAAFRQNSAMRLIVHFAPHLQDAAKPFGFPDTLTAASYVLRRAYAQLLWDFEQVQGNP